MCDVRYGVGSDGVVEIVAAEGRPRRDRDLEPDGSSSEFSEQRSGSRRRGSPGGRPWTRSPVEAGGRPYPAAVRQDGLIAMAVGDVEVGEIETVELGDEQVELTVVSVGNPHAVVRAEPTARHSSGWALSSR